MRLEHLLLWFFMIQLILPTIIIYTTSIDARFARCLEIKISFSNINLRRTECINIDWFHLEICAWYWSTLLWTFNNCWQDSTDFFRSKLFWFTKWRSWKMCIGANFSLRFNFSWAIHVMKIDGNSNMSSSYIFRVFFKNFLCT